ncbi:MAG: ATP-binding protein [Deltaproteobacteria bacterium]
MRIKTKILSIIIATLVLVVFVSAHYSQRMAEKDHEAALREDAEKIVRQVSSYIPANGRLADRAGLEDEFKELFFLSHHLVRIDTFMIKTDGALAPFFSRERYPIERTSIAKSEIELARDGRMSLGFEERPEGNYVNVVAPLRSNGRVFGIAEFKVSHEEFYNLLANRRQTTLYVTIMVVLVIAGALIFSMDRMVNRPIQLLLTAISAVKGGDLAVRVEPAAKDEIGTLTEHFNSMIETISRNTVEKEALLARINSHNDELQQKVGLATEEILKRNAALSVANQSIYNIQKKLGHSRRLAAVGQLAATVAHELGTPLHSISGHLQLLMEEEGLSREMNRRLAIMQSQLERMTGSIQEMLNTTRRHEAGLDIIDLNRMIDDLTLLVLPETLSRQIVMDKDFAQNLPVVLGNSGRLQEVFLNLIDNALDASYDGGKISISTGTADPMAEGLSYEGPNNGGWIKVAVTDNGRGIPEGQIGDIFAPFYTTKAHGRGTGLGLSIANEIIQGHHGRIKAASRPEQGSTFTVFLPSTDKKG